MDTKKGPYLVIKSRTVYKSHLLDIQEDQVIKPDGKEAMFTVINYLPGVSVVVLNRKNEIYLIKEFYYALNDYGLQLPSGEIEEGETPLQSAQKELKEETGISAKQWVDLGLIHPFTTFIKSPAHLFLAYDINEIGDHEIETSVIAISFEEAYKMALDGKISHAQSFVALIKAMSYIKKHPEVANA